MNKLDIFHRKIKYKDMELSEYILLINKLRTEKVSRRAEVLCRRLLSIAIKRNIDTTALVTAHRELVDSGRINIEFIETFKESVAGQWIEGRKIAGKTETLVDLNTDIGIPRGEDVSYLNESSAKLRRLKAKKCN